MSCASGYLDGFGEKRSCGTPEEACTMAVEVGWRRRARPRDEQSDTCFLDFLLFQVVYVMNVYVCPMRMYADFCLFFLFT